MANPSVFKVWNVNRSQRISFCCRCVVETVIQTACEKFGCQYSYGAKLVFESDGTEVDDNEVLRLAASNVFILLLPGETWSQEEYSNHPGASITRQRPNRNTSAVEGAVPSAPQNEFSPSQLADLLLRQQQLSMGVMIQSNRDLIAALREEQSQARNNDQTLRELELRAEMHRTFRDILALNNDRDVIRELGQAREDGLNHARLGGLAIAVGVPAAILGGPVLACFGAGAAVAGVIAECVGSSVAGQATASLGERSRRSITQ